MIIDRIVWCKPWGGRTSWYIRGTLYYLLRSVIYVAVVLAHKCWLWIIVAVSSDCLSVYRALLNCNKIITINSSTVALARQLTSQMVATTTLHFWHGLYCIYYSNYVYTVARAYIFDMVYTVDMVFTFDMFILLTRFTLLAWFTLLTWFSLLAWFALLTCLYCWQGLHCWHGLHCSHGLHCIYYSNCFTQLNH